MVWDEHLVDNGELLPHVLMADVGRFIASHFTEEHTDPNALPSEADVSRVLAVLDIAPARWR